MTGRQFGHSVRDNRSRHDLTVAQVEDYFYQKRGLRIIIRHPKNAITNVTRNTLETLVMTGEERLAYVRQFMRRYVKRRLNSSTLEDLDYVVIAANGQVDPSGNCKLKNGIVYSSRV